MGKLRDRQNARAYAAGLDEVIHGDGLTDAIPYMNIVSKALGGMSGSGNKDDAAKAQAAMAQAQKLAQEKASSQTSTIMIVCGVAAAGIVAAALILRK